MVTLHEVEMLAGLFQARAVVSEIEIIWINDLLNRLRVAAAEAEAAKLAPDAPTTEENEA